jgi:hypothetical protein
MFFCFLFSCWDLLPFPFWGVCPVVVVVAYCYDYFPAIASCTSCCTLLYTMLTRQSAEHGAVKPQNGMSFPHSVSPSPSVHRPKEICSARQTWSTERSREVIFSLLIFLFFLLCSQAISAGWRPIFLPSYFCATIIQTKQANRGFARSRLCTNEDGTSNNFVLYMVRNDTSKKGGNALQATD